MALMFGGLFNIVDPVFGLELYMWAWGFLLVFIGVSYLLGKYVLWNPYTPFHGLYWAWKSGSNAAMIFDHALVGEMVDEKTAKCIFDYSQEEYEVEIPDVPPALQGIVSKIYTKIFYYPTKYPKTLRRYKQLCINSVTLIKMLRLLATFSEVSGSALLQSVVAVLTLILL
jgi:hypothetical protein